LEEGKKGGLKAPVAGEERRSAASEEEQPQRSQPRGVRLGAAYAECGRRMG